MQKLIALIASLCLIAAGFAVVSVMALTSTVTAVLSSSAGANGCTDNTAAAALSVDASKLPTVSGHTAFQLAGAAQIMKAGETAGVGEKGQLIALMTAMQESSLGSGKTAGIPWNEPNGDGDAGWFQQRQYAGWYGSLEMVNDPAISARNFYEGVTAKKPGDWGSAGGGAGYGHTPGLKDIKDWQSMTLTQAASAVQKPAEKYEGKYAKHESEARKLMAALAGVPVSAASTSLSDGTLGCAMPTGVAPEGLPTQAQLKAPSSNVPCPEGTVDLGPTTAGIEGKQVAIRICSIPGTVCTGSDCRKGDLGGKARGEVVLSSLVAPQFMAWLKDVRAAGYNPTFNSSFRSRSTQERLHANSSNAARVDWSNHQGGAAVDIGGLSGTYTRNNCTSITADGACGGTGAAWTSYHQLGLKHGGTIHNEEFWHLEWIVSHPEKRHLAFL
ncbi:hypothetical protein [Brachybacterium huguangmaarense]